MRKREMTFVLALSLGLSGVLMGALSGSGLWLLELDPQETRIEFQLGATFHTVHGSFKLVRGVIRFNPALGTASGEVVIDATSGNSGNRGRDRKMHEKVLESQKFPRITFVPDAVTGSFSRQGKSHIGLHGIVRLHGTEHAVTLPAEVEVLGDAVVASARIKIPYVRWGLKNPGNFFLRTSKEVQLTLHVKGRLSRPDAARERTP